MFLAALAAAHWTSQIEQDPQGQHDAYRQRHRELYKHNWEVYAKTPLGGPAQVLEYLSRYTHRTAIGNERNPQAIESAQAFMQRVARLDVSVCPCCKVGRLHVVAVLKGQARLPASQAQGPP